MKQTIHIFLKDVRRCWPYWTLVLALTVIRTIFTPGESPVQGPATETTNRIVVYVTFVLPALWWLTIARLVHGEKLVGDRQFWVTRPYSRQGLIAAKLLFCLVFLLVPFVISDCLILPTAGFSPGALIPELLARYLFLSGYLLLTPFVLASITSGMRQFMLACLALLLAFVILIQLDSLHPQNDVVNALASPHPGEKTWLQIWSAALFYILLGLGAVAWQYVRRQTSIGRLWGVLLIAWALGATVWPAGAARPSLPDKFPEIAIQFAANRGRIGNSIYPRQGKTEIDIPIEVAGRSPELLDTELASVTIDPAQGPPSKISWDWYNTIADRMPGNWIELHVDDRDFQRLSNGPVTLHATVAVVVYETRSSVKLRPGVVWTTVPGFGSVMPKPEGDENSILLWRRPLNETVDRFVCTIRGPDSVLLGRSQRDGIYPPGSDLFEFSPIVFYAAPFERPGTLSGAPLPPNAEGEFTLEHPVGIVRRDLVIPNIRLADYVPSGVNFNDFR